MHSTINNSKFTLSPDLFAKDDEERYRVLKDDIVEILEKLERTIIVARIYKSFAIIELEGVKKHIKFEFQHDRVEMFVDKKNGYFYYHKEYKLSDFDKTLMRII